MSDEIDRSGGLISLPHAAEDMTWEGRRASAPARPLCQNKQWTVSAEGVNEQRRVMIVMTETALTRDCVTLCTLGGGGSR